MYPMIPTWRAPVLLRNRTRKHQLKTSAAVEQELDSEEMDLTGEAENCDRDGSQATHSSEPSSWDIILDSDDEDMYDNEDVMR